MFDGVLAELFERCKQVSLSTDLTRQLATLELFVSSQPLAKVCDSVGVCGGGGGGACGVHVCGGGVVGYMYTFTGRDINFYA